MVSASSSLGGYDTASAEVAGTRRGCHGWTAVILPRKHSTVLAGGLLMLHLSRDRSAVRFVSPGLLLGRRTRGHSAASAVEGNVRAIVYDHRPVIDIGDVGDIHIGHRAVVEESAAAPFTAGETFAEVSETVINAAIESDVRTPIAGIPKIDAAVPTPVSRSPQKANFRS
jgi:hypothetical protein